YEHNEIGMFLIPTAIADGDVTVDTKNVKRVKITKVVNLTEEYSDVAISLTNIPTSMYKTNISSRMYVAYDDNGVTKYYYGEEIKRNFNAINNSILSELVPSNLKVTGSTSNDYDDDPNTNSISYKTGETITFEIKALYNDMPVNGINLKWTIYQDGFATDISNYTAVASGTAMSVATEPTKISYTPKDSDKLKVEDGGLVYLVVTPCDANGKAYTDAKKFQGGAIYNADAIDASVLKDAAFDTFWQAQMDDVDAFFTEQVKSDLSVTLAELNAGYELVYANGDKISIKPANSSVSGYSSMSSSYYCYEVRIEYGSSTGRAASGFLAFPKNGSTYRKGIEFAGYNTGSAGSLWSVGDFAYIRAESHGIAYDDPETSRKNYNSTYNEANFLFNYNNLSDAELANIAYDDNEFYHMYIRNIYMTRVLGYLNVEDRRYSGSYTSNGGSMGGLQNIVAMALDSLFDEHVLTSGSINLAPWCVNMGSHTEGRITGWQPRSNVITNMNDALHFASLIKNTTFSFDMGLGDTTSPATGVVALYNELKDNQGVKVSMTVNQNKTHGAGDSSAPSFTVKNY
ncbi:MAG: hypothetical protein J6S00_07420, partial [Clostridia bacterium]|nr:hypothetical protein [Clostridia bacterium]